MAANSGLPYPWLEPSSVKSEGKYRCTSDGRVKIIHMVGRRERALLTTDQHPDLVAMIGEVKRAHGDEPSGIFYINEWRHVLVKAGGGTWYAGSYDPILEFDLDGTVISTRAQPGLNPGDRWTGPQVGIRYALAANGQDIYCRHMISKSVERQEYLSDYVKDASSFVRTFSKYRTSGGRLYINEAREMFSPSGEAGHFVYLGFAPVHLWFPEPRPE